jgi:hypothetical protein
VRTGLRDHHIRDVDARYAAAGNVAREACGDGAGSEVSEYVIIKAEILLRKARRVMVGREGNDNTTASSHMVRRKCTYPQPTSRICMSGRRWGRRNAASASAVRDAWDLVTESWYP